MSLVVSWLFLLIHNYALLCLLQASWKGVALGYEFYERVLPELRGWGGDVEALHFVYKCLRWNRHEPIGMERSEENGGQVWSRIGGRGLPYREHK